MNYEEPKRSSETQNNIDDTQGFSAVNNQPYQNPNSYNPNNYNPYSYPPEYPQKSNKGLIAAVSVLAGVIIIGFAVLIMALTGVIRFGGSSQNDMTAAAVETAAPAPTMEAQPIPQQPAQNTNISYYMYVANVKNSIYLRSEPVENDSNIITEIPLGTQVGYIEDANSVFAKISYNGTIGYSKKIYLSATMPYVSSNTAVSRYVYVANVKSSIYLRSAPAENDGNIITEIPLGTQVGFIENVDGVFAKIMYNGQIGYAKQIYLSSSRPSAYTGSGSTMTVVNVAYSIYLRSTPSESSDSNIIMEIPVGSTVTYLGTPNSTFYKISYGGTVGYSKQIYLSFN